MWGKRCDNKEAGERGFWKGLLYIYFFIGTNSYLIGHIRGAKVMPIIIVILVIVFFMPLLNFAAVSFVALGGLLLLLLKALPYILGIIAFIWLLSFVIARVADVSESKKNKAPLTKTKPPMPQSEKDESHKVSLKDLEILGNYYMKYGTYREHPIFQSLTIEQQKSMERLLEVTYKPKKRLDIRGKSN